MSKSAVYIIKFEYEKIYRNIGTFKFKMMTRMNSVVNMLEEHSATVKAIYKYIADKMSQLKSIFRI